MNGGKNSGGNRGWFKSNIVQKLLKTFYDSVVFNISLYLMPFIKIHINLKL